MFADVNTRLQSLTGVELKQASKIYIRYDIALNDEFAAVTRDIFNSEVQNIDFYQSQKTTATADEINAWVKIRNKIHVIFFQVEDHTNKRIKDLVHVNSIGENTVAIFVNAIYFKA